MGQESPLDVSSLRRLAQLTETIQTTLVLLRFYYNSAFKQVKGEINFNNVFYSTQYIQNTNI